MNTTETAETGTPHAPRTYRLKGAKNTPQPSELDLNILTRYLEARDIAARAEATATELEDDARSIVAALGGEYTHEELGRLNTGTNNTYPVPKPADWIEATQAGVQSLVEVLEARKIVPEPNSRDLEEVQACLANARKALASLEEPVLRMEDLQVAEMLLADCRAVGGGFRTLKYLVWRMEALLDLQQAEACEEGLKAWKEAAKNKGIITGRIRPTLKYSPARPKLMLKPKR